MARNICSVEGCDVFCRGHGYCNAHYLRWKRHGDPLGGGPSHNYGGQLSRFKAGFHEGAPDKCWEWTKGRSRGYGTFNSGGKNPVKAHRYSYEYYVGPIPVGLLIRHKCDNPPCVNPNHLETGTKADNARDVMVRGGGFRSRLTGEQVDEIRREINGEHPRLHRIIALDYGVSQNCISRVGRGASWGHREISAA